MSHYPASDPEQTATIRRLRAQFPDAVSDVDDYRGDLSVRVPRQSIVDILHFLREDSETDYNLLVDLCGVDWLGREPRFDVVYHLYSLKLRHRVRVKTGVPEDDPVIASVTTVWRAADWFERECYDLLGVLFRDHPFLRRILTHDDFQGHALRKDYDQRQRWRCTRVSSLESVVEVPPLATTTEAEPAADVAKGSA